MADSVSLRPKNDVDRELLEDYTSALKTIRSVRSIFFGLLVLSLLVPLASFGGVASKKIQAPADGLSSSAAASDVSGVSEITLYAVADAGMRFAPFLARLMTLMLVLVYLVSVHVCLSGRLGGANDSIVAFVWAVLLLLLLIPWHTWMGGQMRMNVYYSLSSLVDAQNSTGQGLASQLQHYVRFLLFPFLALLMAVVADIRFGRCYSQAMKRIRSSMESAIRDRVG